MYPDLDEREFQPLMATYLVHTDDNNSTYRALNEHFSRAGPYEVTAAIPFSSERNLKQQNYPAELIDIYVVADNCIDCTAEIAHAHGARVFERHDRSRVGKGFALSYLLRRIKREYDGYLVFDADNVVDRNYFREINKTFSAGYNVVRREAIGYCPAAVFYDEQLTGFHQSVRQRMC